jgi:hypothetical protein
LEELDLDVIAIEEVTDLPVASQQLASAPVGQTPIPWQHVSDASAPAPLNASAEYLPLVSTIRLYAGWLLAWYFIIYALGSLQFLDRLPISIPYLDELFSSVVILQFSLGAYVILALSSLHRLIGGGALKGIGLGLIGIAIMGVYRLAVG